MIPLSVKLSNLWPGFQGYDIFEVEYRKKRRILKTKLLLHNRKLYLAYGMVLRLVTLSSAGFWAHFTYLLTYRRLAQVCQRVSC